MGRQLALKEHCLLCLTDVVHRNEVDHTHNKGKIVYERNPGGGMLPLAIVCDSCLSDVRGGNWPTDVYAKLSVDRKVEGERAAKTLVPA